MMERSDQRITPGPAARAAASPSSASLGTGKINQHLPVAGVYANRAARRTFFTAVNIYECGLAPDHRRIQHTLDRDGGGPGFLSGQIRGGSIWDKWPSTVARRPTTSRPTCLQKAWRDAGRGGLATRTSRLRHHRRQPGGRARPRRLEQRIARTDQTAGRVRHLDRLRQGDELSGAAQALYGANISPRPQRASAARSHLGACLSTLARSRRNSRPIRRCQPPGLHCGSGGRGIPIARHIDAPA